VILKGGTQGLIFFRPILIRPTVVPFDLERPQLARWHIWGWTYFYGVSHAHQIRGWGAPASPKFFGLHARTQHEKHWSSNHIFTGWSNSMWGNFFMVDHAPIPGQNVWCHECWRATCFQLINFSFTSAKQSWQWVTFYDPWPTWPICQLTR